MSVNINASTTNGLVLTSDTSGELKLQANGADIATVSSTGIAMASGKGLAATGHVLQVQYTQLTSTYSQSITGATDTALTSFEVNITPSSTNSIILLTSSWMGEFGNNDHTYDSTFFFYRNTTKLAHPTASSRNCGIQVPAVSYWETNANSTPESLFMQYIDSPSTTSTITYKVGVRFSGTSTLYTNRNVDDSDSPGRERGISSIIAMEIGA